MANWKTLTGVEDTAEAIEAGYTVDIIMSVDYDDRTVEIPPARFMDTVAAEKHFGDAFKNIADRQEVMAWGYWRRLGRHQDANEHPPDFDVWLETVAQLREVVRIDLDEDVVPKAPAEGG